MPIRLLASGSNSHGQLAVGSYDDAHVFLPSIFEGHDPGLLPSGARSILKISSGANHTLILLDTGRGKQLWACGDSTKGQFSSENEGVLVFKPVTLGSDYDGCEVANVAACWETTFVVLKSSGKPDILLSMGSNDFGLRASRSQNIQSHTNEVDLEGPYGRIVSIISVSCGPRHVLVLARISNSNRAEMDIVMGWGAARHGQLGPLTDPKTSRPLQFTPRPQQVPLLYPGDPVVGLAAGSQHSVVMHTSGRLTILGSDAKAQLRGLHTTRNARFAGCTWNGTVVLSEFAPERPMLVASGSHSKGQLGIGTQDLNGIAMPSQVQLDNALAPLKIACGSEHVLCICAQKMNEAKNEVWGWGWNEHGNLGIGTTEDAYEPVRIWPTNDESINPSSTPPAKCVGIWAGCATSWIAVEDCC